VTNIIYDLAVVAFDYAQGWCCLRLRSVNKTTLRQQKPTQVTKVISGFVGWLSEACFVFTWWLSEVETTIIDFYNSPLHPTIQ
jgi:hypothetical protein